MNLCLFKDLDLADQVKIDELMLQLDGTENKCKFHDILISFNKAVFKNITPSYVIYRVSVSDLCPKALFRIYIAVNLCLI